LNVPNGLSGSAAPRCTRRQRFRIPLGTPTRWTVRFQFHRADRSSSSAPPCE